MVSMNVWSIVSKNSLTKNIRFIPIKWVFKIKSDNRYRSRLVAKGFVQKEGIYYYSSHAPVLTEVGFRSLMLLRLKNGNVLMSIDI